MRAAFIPALPPSALLAGMIAPSFRLVNRFCGKKLVRTCGRRERPPALCAVWARSPLAYVLLRTYGRHERPPALCAVWARSPLAYVKGSLPFDRSLWHRPSLRRTQATRALRAPIWRKKRGMFHPAPTAAGPPARTSRRVVWRGPQAPPSVFRIPGAFPKSSIWRRHPARARDRLPASSGRPASLTCAVDSAALRKQGYLTPAAARRSRRQSRRRSRRPAHPPAEKIGASRAFPPRS